MLSIYYGQHTATRETPFIDMFHVQIVLIWFKKKGGGETKLRPKQM